MIDDLARGEDTNPSVCLLLVTRESMVDIDLVNSLQSLLEDQGILNDIRAKLRSGVLHLLKNNANNNNDSSIKSKTKSAVGAFVSRHGTAALELCFDLLTALELHETLSVLQAESGFDTFQDNREALAKVVGVFPWTDSPDQSRPVLVDVIKKAKIEHISTKSVPVLPPASPTAAVGGGTIFRSPSPSPSTDSPPGASVTTLADRRPALAPISTSFSLPSPADSLLHHNTKSSPSLGGTRSHSPLNESLGESSGSLERYSPKASPLSQSAASVTFNTSRDKEYLEVSANSILSSNSKEKDVLTNSSSQETVNNSIGSASARAIAPLGAIKPSSSISPSSSSSSSSSSLPTPSVASLQALPPLLGKSRAVLPSISSVTLSPESVDRSTTRAFNSAHTSMLPESMTTTPQKNDSSSHISPPSIIAEPAPLLHSPSSARSSASNAYSSAAAAAAALSGNNKNVDRSADVLESTLEESIEEIDESISIAEISNESSPSKPDTDDAVNSFSAPKINISSHMGPSSRVLRVRGSDSDGANNTNNREKVNVGKSGSSVTRSKAGWGTDTRDDDDDFVFTDNIDAVGSKPSPPQSDRTGRRNTVPPSVTNSSKNYSNNEVVKAAKSDVVDSDGSDSLEDSTEIVIGHSNSNRISESVTRKSFLSLDDRYNPIPKKSNNQDDEDEDEEEEFDEYGDDFEDTDDSNSASAAPDSHIKLSSNTVPTAEKKGWASNVASTRSSAITRKTPISMDNSTDMLEDLENDNNEVSVSIASNISDALEFSVGESNDKESNENSFSFINDSGNRGGGRGRGDDGGKSVQSSHEFSVTDELGSLSAPGVKESTYDHAELLSSRRGDGR